MCREAKANALAIVKRRRKARKAMERAEEEHKSAYLRASTSGQAGLQQGASASGSVRGIIANPMQGIGGLLAEYATRRVVAALTNLQLADSPIDSFFEMTFYLAGMGWAAQTYDLVSLAYVSTGVLVWIKKPAIRTALIYLHCLAAGWCLLFVDATEVAVSEDPSIVVVKGTVGGILTAFLF